MKYSANGLALTKRFEGLRLESYKDPAGILTIGYGHTGPDVFYGQTIIQDQANQFLQEDTQAAANDVNQLVNITLNQNQFDALTDFTYNVGAGNFKNSTMLRLINANLIEQAANEFPKWIYANGKILPGLIRRREAERELFVTPVLDNSVV